MSTPLFSIGEECILGGGRKFSAGGELIAGSLVTPTASVIITDIEDSPNDNESLHIYRIVGAPPELAPEAWYSEKLLSKKPKLAEDFQTLMSSLGTPTPQDHTDEELFTEDLPGPPSNSQESTMNEKEFYAMRVGEAVENKDPPFAVLRVPTGWIVTQWGAEGEDFSSVFTPHTESKARLTWSKQHELEARSQTEGIVSRAREAGELPITDPNDPYVIFIERCMDPHRWYAPLIGTPVRFIADMGDELKSLEPNGMTNFVQYCDASLVRTSEIATARAQFAENNPTGGTL